jgi:hypothetical protein
MLNRLIILVCSILICSLVSAQGNPADIKKKISDIRKGTAWNNTDAAKKANDSIAVLSKQLQRAYSRGSIPNTETEEQKKIRESNENYKDKLIDQIIKAAEKGKDSVFLGDVAMDEIYELFEDEEKEEKPGLYYETMNTLCLDMSSPVVQKVIDVMENFKGITTMIITGGENGTAVDFKEIFSRAKEYPLEKLYIINFRNFVNKVPDEIFQFKNLDLLSLVNNSIDNLPLSINNLKKLKGLFVDINPVKTIAGSISQLRQLQNLGISKTGISEEEKDKIKLLLPNCKIE